MMGWLRREPALTAAILSVVGAVLGIFVRNPALVASLVGVAGVFVGVRSVVTPVVSMVEKVTESAATAATETAKALGETTVGVAGSITTTGQSIVDNVVHEVLGGLLGGKPQ